MRALLLASVMMLGWTGAARASVIYDLTLTANAGAAFGGTGSITLAYAPSASGLTSYALSDVSGLRFTIDGQAFASPPGTLSAVQFLDGALRDITFAEQIGTSPNRYSLQTTSGYSFAYNNLQSISAGILSAKAATAVPEPASLALLGLPMGLAALIAVRRRRRGSAGEAGTAHLPAGALPAAC